MSKYILMLLLMFSGITCLAKKTSETLIKIVFISATGAVYIK